MHATISHQGKKYTFSFPALHLPQIPKAAQCAFKWWTMLIMTRAQNPNILHFQKYELDDSKPLQLRSGCQIIFCWFSWLTNWLPTKCFCPKVMLPRTLNLLFNMNSLKLSPTQCKKVQVDFFCAQTFVVFILYFNYVEVLSQIIPVFPIHSLIFGGPPQMNLIKKYIYIYIIYLFIYFYYYF